jgi:hypothetical protein
MEVLMTFLAGMRSALRVPAVVVLCALAVACGSDHESGRNSRSSIEFGIWVPDAGGELRFVATAEVPYVADQAFGWRLRRAPQSSPAKWVEVLRLPKAPESWAGVEESPNITISEDGRTATTLGESLPGDDFVGNVWFVSLGDPAGEYEMSVEFPDGTKATGRFRMVIPNDGPGAESPGMVI